MTSELIPTVVDPAQVAAYVQQRITRMEVGLEPDDPLFWLYAGQAPIKNEAGDNLPLHIQINWAVGKTRSYHTKILTCYIVGRWKNAPAQLN